MEAAIRTRAPLQPSCVDLRKALLRPHYPSQDRAEPGALVPIPAPPSGARRFWEALEVVGSTDEDESLWREGVRARTLRLTNGGVVMMKLFRRKPKMTEPDPGPSVPVSELAPVDVAEGSPTAEAAQPVSATGDQFNPPRRGRTGSR